VCGCPYQNPQRYIKAQQPSCLVLHSTFNKFDEKDKIKMEIRENEAASFLAFPFDFAWELGWLGSMLRDAAVRYVKPK